MAQVTYYKHKGNGKANRWINIKYNYDDQAEDINTTMYNINSSICILYNVQIINEPYNKALYLFLCPFFLIIMTKVTEFTCVPQTRVDQLKCINNAAKVQFHIFVTTYDG